MKLWGTGICNARHAALAAAFVLALSGCKGSDTHEPPAAARVNKREISVQDVEYALGSRGLRPGQQPAAGHEVLEQLIDQELALQAAVARDLDRDPRVQQQIEVARREILARAYLDRVAQKAQAPSNDEIVHFYDSHPQLFDQRRVYTLRQIRVEAPPAAIAQMSTRLASDTIDGFLAFATRGGWRVTDEQVTRPAEQLPMASLPAYARLRPGEWVSSSDEGRLQIDVLLGSTLQPTDFEHARASIAQLLLNDRRRQAVADDLRSLRAIASLQYFGEFARTRGADPRPTSDAPAAMPAAMPVATPARKLVAASLEPSSIDKDTRLK